MPVVRRPNPPGVHPPNPGSPDRTIPTPAMPPPPPPPVPQRSRGWNIRHGSNPGRRSDTPSIPTATACLRHKVPHHPDGRRSREHPPSQIPPCPFFTGNRAHVEADKETDDPLPETLLFLPRIPPPDVLLHPHQMPEASNRVAGGRAKRDHRKHVPMDPPHPGRGASAVGLRMISPTIRSGRKDVRRPDGRFSHHSPMRPRHALASLREGSG